MWKCLAYIANVENVYVESTSHVTSSSPEAKVSAYYG